MKVSAAVWITGLACFLPGVDAINGALGIKLLQLAEMGLLPDGTPMEPPAGSAMSRRRPTAILSSNPRPVAEYVRLPLNHFARNKDYAYDGYFYNRYWVSDVSYRPGAPIFLYDAGEADASLGAVSRLTSESGFFKQLVDKYNGIGIVWEHRYYGNSTPEAILSTTPPEAFRWLNTEQSLADVKAFAEQFSRENIDYDLTPKRTPWIYVGGSYPGMRAAFMRDKYPETIWAGFASSAPTEAKIDMSSYFEPIWQGLHRYGYGNCSRDIQAAVRYVDSVFDRNKHRESSALKEQFLGKGAGDNPNGAFAEALTTIFGTWQAYGIDGGDISLRGFCDHLSTDPKTDKTSGKAGWARSKGAKWVAEHWARYENFPHIVNYLLGTQCSKDVDVASADCNLNRPYTDPAMISWTWQYCTQWGYFQSANLGPHQIVSRYNSLHHQKNICHRQFPTATWRDHGFPDWPRVEETNEKFGGWDLRPSQVYWSGGEFDPWRVLSPLADGQRVRESSRAPKCGEEQDRHEMFGYVLPNAQHCYDFKPDYFFPEGKISRAHFTKALDRWLKCFKPRRH